MAALNNLNVCGATLTRRQFVKTGGSLIVCASVLGSSLWEKTIAAAGGNSLDATLPGSWFEIRGDNTILMRTGKTDFGQTTAHTAFKQIAAEELNVPFEAITTVVMGDTDRTPDGGVTAGLLRSGTPNVRKAAAYTQQALLELAAVKFGVNKSQLSVKDGVISGGGRKISYGELVQGQQLKLSIPVTGNLTDTNGLIVTGNPPMKPVRQYTIIGKSFPNQVTVAKVTAAQETWVTDLRLPNMLHARVVHPKTLGSTLVAAGQVDKERFPNAQVVVKGNLVGVLAPTEWESIRASRQVAADTKWTDWKGLAASSNLYAWLRTQADWKTTPVSAGEKNQGSVGPALAGAVKKLSAGYELPYMKHAPIGPTMAVADSQANGSMYVYANTQQPSQLRGQVAMMLGTSIDNVVIRSLAGAGHYGRSNGGNSGAECEAAILSKAVGRPVRLQWMRADDLMWSTQSPPGYSDIEIGLDAGGKITAYQVHHHGPAMQDDRLLGAVLAGLPTSPAPSATGDQNILNSTILRMRDPWLYDHVPNLAEYGRGTVQLGQEASPLAVGLRDHSMRTPTQFQQNFPREMAFSEAAALTGVDALQFRLNHTTDERLIGVLTAIRDASGWQSRPSPTAGARSTGSTPLPGQGVAVMQRGGAYWACVCQISITPGTGKLAVDKCTIAVDPGIVINPMQLKRQVEAGGMMGISHALHEEMTFDESNVTSRDWRSYPILTMAEVPEMKVVILSRPDATTYYGASEAANALPAPAIAAAILDATGKPVRRLPLKPAYLQAVLNR